MTGVIVLGLKGGKGQKHKYLLRLIQTINTQKYVANKPDILIEYNNFISMD